MLPPGRVMSEYSSDLATASLMMAEALALMVAAARTRSSPLEKYCSRRPIEEPSR